MTLRPNIVYLHSHDTGRHIQPYGHQVPTPNIQRLADQGLLFRQAFSAAPVCSGSRAALLTGEYSHTNGMLGLAHRGYRLADYDHHLVHTLRDGGLHVDADRRAAPVAPTREDIGYDQVVEIDSSHARARSPRRPRRSCATADASRSSSRRLLRDPPRLLRADLGPRRALLAAARQPPRHARDAPRHGRLQGQRALAGPGRRRRAGRARRGRAGREHARDPHHRPRARLPGREGDADRPRDRRAADHARARRLPRRPASPTRSSPRSTSSRRSASSPGIERPEWVRGRSLLPLLRKEAEEINDAVFAEITFHAAYEPQRAVRTKRYKYIRRFENGHEGPVLANIDDSPSKDLPARPRAGRSRRARGGALRPRLRSQRGRTTSPPIPRTRTIARRAARAAGALDGGDRRPAARRPGRARCRARRSTTPTSARRPIRPRGAAQLMPRARRPPDAGRRPGRAAGRLGRSARHRARRRPRRPRRAAARTRASADFAVALGSGATAAGGGPAWVEREIEWLRAADAAGAARSSASASARRRWPPRSAAACTGSSAPEVGWVTRRHRRRRARSRGPVAGLARGRLHAAAAGLRARLATRSACRPSATAATSRCSSTPRSRRRSSRDWADDDHGDLDRAGHHAARRSTPPPPSTPRAAARAAEMLFDGFAARAGLVAVASRV